MKFKGDIETIKELENLIRQYCNYVTTYDASNGKHRLLGDDTERVAYSKTYVIHSKPCLIILRLEFDKRDNTGRFYLKDNHVNILRSIAPELNRKLGEIRQIYFGRGGKNGIANNAMGNRRHPDHSLEGKGIPQVS